MGKSGQIAAVCISTEKGVPKTPVEDIRLVEHHGVEGDAHAGTGREVSLLCESSIAKIRKLGLDVGPGDFAENLTLSGLSAEDFAAGLRLSIRTDGEEALLEVTQIGKECHTGCAIRRQVGDCVMPREGIFAKVLKGGPVRPGSIIEVTDAD
ncbi:MAG: MOSC domain-containing protein [Candidatus Brocadiae bacterium]|nr:MOSC domain-containing protein [Candidatus Brocadiia bacterium]